MISTPVVCPHFVGRQAELAYLIERRRALAQSHGGIVLVGGEAGIGKSRLVRAFLNSTGKSRGRIAVGRCRSFATAPYGPLVEMLATLTPGFEPLVPERNIDAQLSAIADALLAAANAHAIVGIIEDLHWSDSGTLRVLALMAERIATSRMLLVATYRSNEFAAHHPHFGAFGALQRSASVAAIGLGPLAAHDVRDFIDATLYAVAGSLPLEQRRKVERVSEGNPFFTEELLKDVLERSRLQRPERSLPTTIHAAILERMQPLAAADRAVLTQAAVIGRQFEANLLAHTLETDIAAILPVLQRARLLQIVEETDDATTFRFRHALTREAIYEELLTAQRQPLHRRIALALESQTAWSASPDALAYHWWAAGDRAQALEHGLRGGDAAQAVHAYADAIECYERTLSLLDSGGRDAALLHAKIGTCHYRSGVMDRAIEHFAAAWQFYQSTNDDAAFLFTLARSFAAATYNSGRRRESTIFLRGAVDTIARCGDPGVTSRARLTLANWIVESGDITETMSLLNGIDAELLAGDAQLTASFWQTTCRVYELEGNAAGVRTAAERIFATGAPPDAATIEAFTEAGMSALIVGEAEVARRCFARATDLCVVTRSSTLHGSLLVTCALERILAGAFEEARALIRASLPLIGDVEISRQAVVRAAIWAGAMLNDRELLAFEPDAGAVERAFEIGPIVYGPLAAAYAELLASRGEAGAARRLLTRALHAATAAVPFSGSFPLVIVAAQQCDREGIRDVRALCAATAALGPAGRAGAELGEAILQSRYGFAPAAGADTADALARRAASGFGAIGWPVYEALARDIAGETEAARSIRELAGLAQAHAPAAPAETDLRALLTPREAEVATLVTSGRTNREIASALNVSVKLVEKSLSSIYAKCAVTSRSQLTALLIAGDNRRPVR